MSMVSDRTWQNLKDSVTLGAIGLLLTYTGITRSFSGTVANSVPIVRDYSNYVMIFMDFATAMFAYDLYKSYSTGI